MNKNILIALVVVVIAGIAYFMWANEQKVPAVEAVPQDENGVDVKVNGEVQGTWEETGKDGGAEQPN